MASKRQGVPERPILPGLIHNCRQRMRVAASRPILIEDISLFCQESVYQFLAYTSVCLRLLGYLIDRPVGQPNRNMEHLHWLRTHPF